MSHLSGNERAKYVRSMFARIAPRYDLLNRLMTLGQDIRWRKEAIRQLEIKEHSVIVDLGTGTGDIALEIARQFPKSTVIASDFTPEMIWVGKERPKAETIHWVIADAQHLPFADNRVDGAISGFLLRNVPDLELALQEQYRVISDKGRIVSLDTSPPRDNILKPFLQFHLHYIIPFLGKIIAGDSEAYTYLPTSTEKFLSAEKLETAFSNAGLIQVGFVRRMLGTIGIHWGEKPQSNI